MSFSRTGFVQGTNWMYVVTSALRGEEPEVALRQLSTAAPTTLGLCLKSDNGQIFMATLTG